MKICYVGNNENGSYALSEIIKKISNNINEHTELTRVAISSSYKINEIIDVLLKSAMECYVFDISSFNFQEEETVRAIESVKQSTNSIIVIYAPGYMKDSRILTSLNAIGINKIITEEKILGNIKSELYRYITTKNEANPVVMEELIENREILFQKIIEENPLIEKLKEYDEIVEPKNEDVDESEEVFPNTFIIPKATPMKIAVVGSKRGIGTTTAAIQLVKYLNSCEPGSAAYLEYNQTGYLDNLENTYILDHEDHELEKYVFKSVEMYKNPRKLALLPQYDYMIYDYGSVEDIVDLSSLYEKDHIILVGGAKPNANEMGKMTIAMKMVYDQKNVFYLFNFIHQQEQKGVIEMQGELADNTGFISYAPSPFILNPDHSKLYHSILTRPKKSDEHQQRKTIFQRVFPKK